MSATSELIVSVSGIRGIVGESLTSDHALSFASALGTSFRRVVAVDHPVEKWRVVLSRDSRPSGQVLRHAVLAGLMDAGCDVFDLGVAPTPTVGLALRKLLAIGGLQITASHNPAPWNGLKMFGDTGAVLDARRGAEVKEIYQSGKFHRAAWNQLGQVNDCAQAETWHRDCVLQLVETAKIQKSSLRVFLDANGGAGGSLGRDLLTSLSPKNLPIIEGGGMDGNFAHPPEPLAENLQSILAKVPACRADIGFVLDPDADRLAIIDEKGQYIGEELTLALAVLFRLRQQKGPVVINMSTSRVVEDLAQQAGVECHRSAVGEANVVEEMRRVGAVIGGEGNGGVIDPRVGWVRDPFIGMGLILNLMAESGKKVSELVAELPTYAIVKDKYTVARERLPSLNDKLVARWPDAKVNRVDGLRLDWERSWLHVRPSNTEPIVRVIAEAPLREHAVRLCQEVGGLRS
jgi:phosphomannomutase